MFKHAQVGSVVITAAAWYIMPRSEYLVDDAGSAGTGFAEDTFAILGFSGWRLLYAMEGVVAILCLLLLWVILPESPRFLLLRRRKVDLERLHTQLETMLRMGGLELAPDCAGSSSGDSIQVPLLSPSTGGNGHRTVDDLIAKLSAEMTEGADGTAAETMGGNWRVLFRGELLRTTLLTTAIWYPLNTCNRHVM
jgi:hypothetical protein